MWKLTSCAFHLTGRSLFTFVGKDTQKAGFQRQVGRGCGRWFVVISLALKFEFQLPEDEDGFVRKRPKPR